ncbi:MAG: hypothetical protein ABFC89_01240, partial [Methanospirillum sp.]
ATILAEQRYRPVGVSRRDEAPREFFDSPRGKALLREVLLGTDDAPADRPRWGPETCRSPTPGSGGSDTGCREKSGKARRPPRPEQERRSEEGDELLHREA